MNWLKVTDYHCEKKESEWEKSNFYHYILQTNNLKMLTSLFSHLRRPKIRNKFCVKMLEYLTSSRNFCTWSKTWLISTTAL